MGNNTMNLCKCICGSICMYIHLKLILIMSIYYLYRSTPKKVFTVGLLTLNTSSLVSIIALITVISEADDVPLLEGWHNNELKITANTSDVIIFFTCTKAIFDSINNK